MLAHERFVFVHVHRTGGQFAAAWLRAHLELEEVGYHAPIADVPARHAGKPVVGFVRSPWDWYASWYAFNAPAPKNPIFPWVSNQGRFGFEETLRQLLALGADDPYFAALRAGIATGLPPTRAGRGAGLVRDDLESLRPDRGYFSWLFERMLGPAPAFVGRFERLREDLVSMLESVGVEVTDAMRRDVVERAPINASARRPLSEVYDAQLAAEVAEADAALIARFGYAPP